MFAQGHKFPSSAGFTGSCGKSRGGSVKLAKGGAVHDDEAQDRALFKKMAAGKKAGGKVRKHK